jgi:septal ring factor EnvC (AmiA/AmiB activator)
MPKAKKTTLDDKVKTARKVKKVVKKSRVKTIEANTVVEQKQHIEDIREEIARAVKAEREKRLILWSGVAFFMVVIFIFWVYNLKDSFKKIESETAGKSDFKWSEITGDFGKSMEEMKKNLAEIKEFTKTVEETTTSAEDNIASTTRDIFSEQDEVEELRARLEKLEGKLGTTSPNDNIQ